MGSSLEIGTARAEIPAPASCGVAWERILLRLVLCIPLLVLTQCKSVDGGEGKLTSGGEAAIALGQPIAFSGNPGRDARALGGSNQIIQLADWGRMSAGQNWSKIFGKHQVYGEKGFTARLAPPRGRPGTFPPFTGQMGWCRFTTAWNISEA